MYELLLWSLLLSAQWQFGEQFTQRKNPAWLLHNATLAAGVPIFIGGTGWLFSAVSLVIVLRSRNLRPLNLVQWAFAFLFPLIAASVLANAMNWPLDFKHNWDIQSEYWELVPLVLLLFVTLRQMTYSFRKANLTNKSRSVIAFIMIVLGLMGYALNFGSAAIAITMFALSFQVSNALYYLSQKWYYELIALVFVAVVLANSYGLISWTL